MEINNEELVQESQAQNSNNEDELKEITVRGHKYVVDNLLNKTNEFNLYKIHDGLNREFALKITSNVDSQKQSIQCLELLKNKPCIASIFDYELLDDHLNVIFELGQPIDVLSIPKNLLKRRMRQLLTAVASVHSAGLHFADLNLVDFIDTNGGIRLIHFEPLLTNTYDEDESTFAPARRLLEELVEPRKSQLDPSLYKDLQKCISTAATTETCELQALITSQIFRDCFKVTIKKTNRAMTPDPHNLVLMKKKRPQKSYESEEPILLRKTKEYDIPSSSYISFLGIGIFLSVFFILMIQLSLKYSNSFTGLALKIGWIGVCVCSALFFATVKIINNEDDSAGEYAYNLKKWCRALSLFILLTIGCQSLEMGVDSTTIGGSITLTFWLISSYIV